MWLEFKRPFRWRPIPAVTVSYPPGVVVCVTRACAAAARKAGAAIPAQNPKAIPHGQTPASGSDDAQARI